MRLHNPCPGRRWVSIPDGVELWKPREGFYDSLKPVTLTQREAQRKDGTNVTIFTQYDIIGGRTMRRESDPGTRLDKGCGL